MTTTDGYVLLVDDDDIVHFLSRLTLGDLAYNGDVMIANDGVEACEVLAECGQPQLMLLDLRMPGMDGRKVLETVDRGDFGPPPPTVIMTGSSRPEDRALGGFYGFVQGFIRKPFRAEDLLALAGRGGTFDHLFACS